MTEHPFLSGRQLSSLDTLENKNAGKPEQTFPKQKPTPELLLPEISHRSLSFTYISKLLQLQQLTPSSPEIVV